MPATSQRAVPLVNQGMTWNEVLTYLTDLNVIGKGFDYNLRNFYKSFKH